LGKPWGTPETQEDERVAGGGGRESRILAGGDYVKTEKTGPQRKQAGALVLQDRMMSKRCNQKKPSKNGERPEEGGGGKPE